MPVISSNALVSVFDSYSCVGMVSDSTLISMPLKGAAALMNHSISFNCCSLVSVEGWNSLSIQRLASSMPAKALLLAKITARAAVIVNRLCMAVSSQSCMRRLLTLIEQKRMSIENVFAPVWALIAFNRG